jgi:hypothetical protein
MIAVAAILGAVAAWRASVAASSGANLARVAVQQRLLQAEANGRYEAESAHDASLTIQYNLASTLPAGENHAVQRWLTPMFFVGPLSGPFDRQFEQTWLRAEDPDTLRLQPVVYDLRADAAYRHESRLVGIAGLFVLALFFFSLAHLVVSRFWPLFFGLGAATIVATLVLLGLVGP